MTKRFDVVLSDCPWRYRDKATAGKRGVEFKYKTMSERDLKLLPVQSIASDNSICFMWVTNPMLPVGLRVMKSWGFDFVTVAFVWVKTNKKSTDTVFWGMGNWSRSGTECVLLGVRGKPKRKSKSVHQVVFSPVREHSRKPDEVREKIEELMGPDVSKIELFATEIAEGWESIGYEIDGRDIRHVLSEMTGGSDKLKRFARKIGG